MVMVVHFIGRVEGRFKCGKRGVKQICKTANVVYERPLMLILMLKTEHIVQLLTFFLCNFMLFQIDGLNMIF
jgi:hypothetical protein